MKKKKEDLNGSPEHYNSVLLEDIKSKMELVIEGMYTIKDELSRKIDETKDELKQDIKLNQLAITKTREDMSAMECRLKQEISDVRTELKQDIADVRTDMRSMEERLKQEISDVRVDMHAMENRLTEKIEGNNTRLKDHDKRISVLEEKII